MDTAEASPSEKGWRRVLKGIATLVALSTVAWMLFTFVITDRAMFLDYLRVLAWPTLVAVALFWLRDPLRDKLRQLLRIEVPGGAAQFSGAALEREVKPDVDNLLGESDAGDGHRDGQENGTAAAPVSVTEKLVQVASAPNGAHGPTEGAPVEAMPTILPSEHPAEVGATTDATARPPVVSVSRHRVAELAKTVGLGPRALVRVLKAMDGDPDDALRMIDAAAASVAQRSQDQNRESIESIIKKSAAWGYERGSAGAPIVVPDIEWNEDGTWRITTEVPAPVTQRRGAKGGADAVARAAMEDASHGRHVKELQDEIKKLERERLSPFRGGISRLEVDPWLHELKLRLSRIDPGNPWT